MSDGDDRNRQEGRGLGRDKTTEQPSLDERAAAGVIAALGGAVDRRANRGSGNNSGSGGEGREEGKEMLLDKKTNKRSRSSFNGSGYGVEKGGFSGAISSSSSREREKDGVVKTSKNENALLETAATTAASGDDERAMKVEYGDQEPDVGHPSREHLSNDRKGDRESGHQETATKRARITLNQEDHDTNSKSGTLVTATATVNENASESLNAYLSTAENLYGCQLPPKKKKTRSSGLDSDSNLNSNLNWSLDLNLNSRSNLSDPKLTDFPHTLTSNRVSNPQVTDSYINSDQAPQANADGNKNVNNNNKKKHNTDEQTKTQASAPGPSLRQHTRKSKRNRTNKQSSSSWEHHHYSSSTMASSSYSSNNSNDTSTSTTPNHHRHHSSNHSNDSANSSSASEPAEASSMSDGGYEGGKSESNSGSGSGSEDGRMTLLGNSTHNHNPDLDHLNHLVQWSTHHHTKSHHHLLHKHHKHSGEGMDVDGVGVDDDDDDESPVSSSSDAGSEEPPESGSSGLLLDSTEDPFPDTSGSGEGGSGREGVAGGGDADGGVSVSIVGVGVDNSNSESTSNISSSGGGANDSGGMGMGKVKSALGEKSRKGDTSGACNLKSGNSFKSNSKCIAMRGYESSTGSTETNSEREKSETTTSETISALSSRNDGTGSGSGSNSASGSGSGFGSGSNSVSGSGSGSGEGEKNNITTAKGGSGSAGATSSVGKSTGTQSTLSSSLKDSILDNNSSSSSSLGHGIPTAKGGKSSSKSNPQAVVNFSTGTHVHSHSGGGNNNNGIGSCSGSSGSERGSNNITRAVPSVNIMAGTSVSSSLSGGGVEGSGSGSNQENVIVKNKNKNASLHTSFKVNGSDGKNGDKKINTSMTTTSTDNTNAASNDNSLNIVSGTSTSNQGAGGSEETAGSSTGNENSTDTTAFNPRSGSGSINLKGDSTDSTSSNTNTNVHHHHHHHGSTDKKDKVTSKMPKSKGHGHGHGAKTKFKTTTKTVKSATTALSTTTEENKQSKTPSTSDNTGMASSSASDKSSSNATSANDSNINNGGGIEVAESETGVLRPAPYFYYVDHSQEEDEDPLTPVTPSARVPNFPAKMHALLMREDLKGVICWMPHGRAFKIVNPRDFELRVIPTYFEHSKISSFVRQAQGWGFRKLTKGRERHAFYNEYFLRGLPHLCKKMTRPSLTKKVICDPDHEPDLFRISMEHPVPDSISLDDMNYTVLEAVGKCILDGGPKARLPVIHSMNFSKPSSLPIVSGHGVYSQIKETIPQNNEVERDVPHPKTANRMSSNTSASTDVSLAHICASKSLDVFPPSSSSASLSTVSGYFHTGDSTARGLREIHSDQRKQVLRQQQQRQQQQSQQQQQPQQQQQQQHQFNCAQQENLHAAQPSLGNQQQQQPPQLQQMHQQPNQLHHEANNLPMGQNQLIQAFLQQQYLSHVLSQQQQNVRQQQQQHCRQLASPSKHPTTQGRSQSVSHQPLPPQNNSLANMMQLLQSFGANLSSGTNESTQPSQQQPQRQGQHNEPNLNDLLQFIQEHAKNPTVLGALIQAQVQNHQHQSQHDAPSQWQQQQPPTPNQAPLQQLNMQNQDAISILATLIGKNASNSSIVNSNNSQSSFIQQSSDASIPSYDPQSFLMNALQSQNQPQACPQNRSSSTGVIENSNSGSASTAFSGAAGISAASGYVSSKDTYISIVNSLRNSRQNNVSAPIPAQASSWNNQLSQSIRKSNSASLGSSNQPVDNAAWADPIQQFFSMLSSQPQTSNSTNSNDNGGSNINNPTQRPNNLTLPNMPPIDVSAFRGNGASEEAIMEILTQAIAAGAQLGVEAASMSSGASPRTQNNNDNSGPASRNSTSDPNRNNSSNSGGSTSLFHQGSNNQQPPSNKDHRHTF